MSRWRMHRLTWWERLKARPWRERWSYQCFICDTCLTDLSWPAARELERQHQHPEVPLTGGGAS